MQLISKYNKGIRYLLCVIDLFSRYAWVIPLKNKKGESIVEEFEKILDDSDRKPNKIWVDHGSEFYNNKFKSFLKENDIEMYSTFNEGKSVFAERFIKTLKNKIYKHLTTIGKNVYIDVLDDIVKKYSNTVHSSMKMKDVTDIKYVEYSEETNRKDPKFKIGDNVRISKYKNIFAKQYTPNWSEEVFVVNKVQNTVPWNYFINDLNGEKIKSSFYEKELQKTDQKKFRIEKVIKKKGNKLHVKWKGYDNSCNNWIDKKTYHKMSYIPTYSEVEEEIVSVTLNLSNYVTQKEFKSLTKVDTSDFALKTNVAEIKKTVDDIDIDKINGIDELQGKNYIEDSYLYLNQKYKYFKGAKTDTQKLLI